MTFIVRTPRETALETEAMSIRLPTQTGQVGLHPHCEPCVLAVEPGLILLKTVAKDCCAGTAGGVLRTDGTLTILLTPLAVIGDHFDELQTRLDAALVEPKKELEARRTISRLERDIVQALHATDETLRPLQRDR